MNYLLVYCNERVEKLRVFLKLGFVSDRADVVLSANLVEHVSGHLELLFCYVEHFRSFS